MHVLWRLHMVASSAIEFNTCDFSILHLSKGKQIGDEDKRGTHQVWEIQLSFYFRKLKFKNKYLEGRLSKLQTFHIWAPQVEIFKTRSHVDRVHETILLY
jgi:hypothetical protein